MRLLLDLTVLSVNELTRDRCIAPPSHQSTPLGFKGLPHFRAPVLLYNEHGACCFGEYGLDNAPNIQADTFSAKALPMNSWVALCVECSTSIQFSLFPAHINISYSNNNVYILCRKRGGQKTMLMDVNEMFNTVNEPSEGCHNYTSI